VAVFHILELSGPKLSQKTVKDWWSRIFYGLDNGYPFWCTDNIIKASPPTPPQFICCSV